MTEPQSQPGASPLLAAPFTPGVVNHPANRTPRVLDLTQVAELLDAHPKTVRLMAQAGKIPAFRVGRLWRFSATRIYEWIDNPQAA